jgi:hypothetical protein
MLRPAACARIESARARTTLTPPEVTGAVDTRSKKPVMRMHGMSSVITQDFVHGAAKEVDCVFVSLLATR